MENRRAPALLAARRSCTRRLELDLDDVLVGNLSPVTDGRDDDLFEVPFFAGGDHTADLATILRRALVDLASALQDIERQLASCNDDEAATTRG